MNFNPLKPVEVEVGKSTKTKLVVWVGGLELGARPCFFGRTVRLLIQI